MSKGDLRKLIKAMEANGLTVVLSKNGHYKVYRDGAMLAVIPGTTSDWRSIRNSIAQIRKATGIDLKESK
jgi:hypothetical protein